MKNLRELKAELEFKRQQAEDPSLHSKQFYVNFRDGKTIFLRPELMQKANGFPVLNFEKYIEENHPERLSEYKQIIAQREGELRRTVDEPLEKRRHESPYQSFFNNF